MPRSPPSARRTSPALHAGEPTRTRPANSPSGVGFSSNKVKVGGTSPSWFVDSCKRRTDRAGRPYPPRRTPSAVEYSHAHQITYLRDTERTLTGRVKLPADDPPGQQNRGRRARHRAPPRRVRRSCCAAPSASASADDQLRGGCRGAAASSASPASGLPFRISRDALRGRPTHRTRPIPIKVCIPSGMHRRSS
jgi:hypothetical protein